MTVRFGIVLFVAAGTVCLALAPVEAVAAEEPKAESPGVRLFRQGRPVPPVLYTANMTEYLENLASSVGTVATQSYLTMEGRKTPSPAPVGKAARPAFAWLAEAITAKPVSFAVDDQGRWCFYMHGDPDKKFSYAASGGVIAKIDYFSRRKTGSRIWTLTKFIFDHGLAKDVVATQMRMDVLEAVSSDGKKFPARKPDGKEAARKRTRPQWIANQQRISLDKASFPGDLIGKLHVRGQVALRTGTAVFTIQTLKRDKPVVMKKSGVTVTVLPLREGKRSGEKTWEVPVEVRTDYTAPPGMSRRGESIFFGASDGKRLDRASWKASHVKGLHTIVIRIRPHSIDPASTRMVIEYPTGLKILPVELTFRNVAIRDIPAP